MGAITYNGKVITAPSGKWVAPLPPPVTIGLRTYKTALMPDGKVWLAENLDYAWTGLHIQQSDDDEYQNVQAAYYNFDEATYGWDGLHDGLLYTWYAVRALENNKDTLLPAGWRVPTDNDYVELINSLGGTEVAGGHLKSVSGWISDGNGDGTTAFDAKPVGFRSYASGMPFGGHGDVCLFWTISRMTFFPYQYRMNYYSAAIRQDHNPENQHCSLRLVKEYTV